MTSERAPLTRAELIERRAAVASDRKLGRLSGLRIGASALVTVLTLALTLFLTPALAWVAALVALWPAGLLLARFRLEPRKRRVGYICPGCRGTFPTDADDFRLILRGGRCLRCAAPILNDPELPPGSHRLPPMTALGER
jgi:hypothetical protein